MMFSPEEIDEQVACEAHVKNTAYDLIYDYMNCNTNDYIYNTVARSTSIIDKNDEHKTEYDEIDFEHLRKMLIDMKILEVTKFNDVLSYYLLSTTGDVYHLDQHFDNGKFKTELKRILRIKKPA